jgi:AcrR family transcriptional regulator
MQQDSSRRSNRERTEATRAALVSAARALFVEKSYAETGTPEIVAAAGVTRGALYHHFADKQALFAAVVEAESAAVAREVEQAAPAGVRPLDALKAGGAAFLAAMAQPGRARLLLLDGPAVLGHAAMNEIEGRHGGRTLRDGLSAAMADGSIRPLPVDVLATLFAAAFDRAALAIEQGDSPQDHLTVMAALVDGLRA